MTLQSEFQVTLSAVRMLLDGAGESASEPASAMVAGVLSELPETLMPGEEIHPARLPACRHLAAAFQGAAVGPPLVAGLASALADLDPFLIWRQNPNYGPHNIGEGYMENYAYADLIGPNGLTGHTRVAVGFLLLGPGLLYPDHSHPAEEAYVVISGDATWRCGSGKWVAHPPGRLIHHNPWDAHATWTHKVPLLACYAWLGGVDVMARLAE